MYILTSLSGANRTPISHIDAKAILIGCDRMAKKRQKDVLSDIFAQKGFAGSLVTSTVFKLFVIACDCYLTYVTCYMTLRL